MRKLLYWLSLIFKTSCPNCESAWTGGHSNPESIDFCVLCSNPKTGKVRGWIWRIGFLMRRNRDKNFEASLPANIAKDLQNEQET